MKLIKTNKPTEFTDIMQCFCNWQKTNNKTNVDSDFTGSKNSEGKIVPAKICSYFFSDKDVSKAMGLTIAIFIVVINLILQMVIIRCVDWIGEDTHS